MQQGATFGGQLLAQELGLLQSWDYKLKEEIRRVEKSLSAFSDTSKSFVFPATVLLWQGVGKAGYVTRSSQLRAKSCVSLALLHVCNGRLNCKLKLYLTKTYEIPKTSNYSIRIRRN